MNSFLINMKNEADMTHTENGAVAYATTGSDCLDLFAAAGALRHATEEDIITRFVRAYTEDRDTAMKILFFARDVRSGLGERRLFRVIMNWLADNDAASVIKNIENISEFGRFDDLLCLLSTDCEADMLSYIQRQLTADITAAETDGTVSLLAKWLPSANASSAAAAVSAKHIARHLGMNEAEYRKTLVWLRSRIGIIENSLRERDYTFDYAKQPSKAMLKYRRAFMRNDRQRYADFIDRVNRGEAELHAASLMPYELVSPFLSEQYYTPQNGFMRAISAEEKDVLNASWASLPDYAGDDNALAVIDTSGSMYCWGKPLPAAVALSLGLYFAEHSKGPFANCFIEFSEEPQLIFLKGDTFADRLQYAAAFSRVANTDIEAVFDLILRTAVKNGAARDELPRTLYIISDMEFDCCTDNASLSNFENAAAKFARCGYKLPQVIFWNVASRSGNQPVRQNEQGAALVSGCTPRIFAMAAGHELSPYEYMTDILSSERYANITAGR